MKPRIESVWFGGEPFARMARVFEATARKWASNWDLNVRHVDQLALAHHGSAGAGHIANTQKLDVWNGIVQAAPDGARILLIDTDTFFTNPIDDIWDRDFDLAYTTRYADLPINLGVMFIRVSDPVRKAFSELAETNRTMLTDESAHNRYRFKYGGMNQAAFGKMLETGALADLTLLDLPCREWNCEDSAWATFDARLTRIVHVKSALRRAIFDGSVRDTMKPGVIGLATRWSRLEASTLADA